MKRFLFVLFTVFATFYNGISQDNNAIAQEAWNLSKSGETEKAIAKYESLSDNGSADIYYNLGRLYQENGQIAKAALNYERALRIDSNHSQAVNNLAIIREKTDFDIIPVDKMFLIRWWDALANVFSANVWMLISLILGVGWLVALYYWWIANRPKYKKKAFIASMVMPLLLGISLSLGKTAKEAATNHKYAIVMNQDYDMHEGADERSPITKDLEAGTKVEIIDQIDQWIKVETADTESGWLKESEVERI